MTERPSTDPVAAILWLAFYMLLLVSPALLWRAWTWLV